MYSIYHTYIINADYKWLVLLRISIFKIIERLINKKLDRIIIMYISRILWISVPGAVGTGIGTEYRLQISLFLLTIEILKLETSKFKLKFKNIPEFQVNKRILNYIFCFSNIQRFGLVFDLNNYILTNI